MLDDLLIFVAMFVKKAEWWFDVIMRSDKQLHDKWIQVRPFPEMKRQWRTPTMCCFYMQFHSSLFILCKSNLKKNTSRPEEKYRSCGILLVRAFVAEDGSSNDSTLNTDMQQSPSIPYVRSSKSQSLFQDLSPKPCRVLSWMTDVIRCFRIPQDDICHEKTPRHSKTINTTICLYIYIFLLYKPYNISVGKLCRCLPQESFWWDLATNCPAKFYPWASALQNLGPGERHRKGGPMWGLMGIAWMTPTKAETVWEDMHDHGIFMNILHFTWTCLGMKRPFCDFPYILSCILAEMVHSGMGPSFFFLHSCARCVTWKLNKRLRFQ